MTASGPAGGKPLPGPVRILKYGAATLAAAWLSPASNMPTHT